MHAPSRHAPGCLACRYEIKDILPPRGIVQAMELQAEAERRKRASILESEGMRQSKINVAEADKQQVRDRDRARPQQQASSPHLPCKPAGAARASDGPTFVLNTATMHGMLSSTCCRVVDLSRTPFTISTAACS